MSKVRASNVGFCVVDSNADVIADNLIHRIREAAGEMESQVNRLYRGRQSYDLTQGAKQDLEKAIERLNYMARTPARRSKRAEQGRLSAGRRVAAAIIKLERSRGPAPRLLFCWCRSRADAAPPLTPDEETVLAVPDAPDGNWAVPTALVPGGTTWRESSNRPEEAECHG